MTFEELVERGRGNLDRLEAAERNTARGVAMARIALVGVHARKEPALLIAKIDDAAFLIAAGGLHAARFRPVLFAELEIARAGLDADAGPAQLLETIGVAEIDAVKGADIDEESGRLLPEEARQQEIFALLAVVSHHGSPPTPCLP